MKITAIESLVIQVNQRGDWVFVLVHTDEGLTGLGEASHSGNDALLLATLRQFEERLCGQDPRQINSIWQSLRRLDGGRIAHTALSGVEQALWDILGQSLGMPIYALFGGALRDGLRLYANINRHVTDRSPAGFARAATEAVGQGFTAVKLAPFDELRAPDHVRSGPYAAWLPGVERVRAVRAAIGEQVELLVDCHGRMEASEALLVGHALVDCSLYWYEEPVPDHHIDDLAQLSAILPMPTASGESLFGIEEFCPLLQRRVVDMLMPDVKHDGGLAETRHIAEAARLSGLLIAPHNPAGPLATASTAHVASTLTNFAILEYAWGEVPWRADVLDPPERIIGGYLHLPRGPGLGHRLSMETVNRHLRGQVTSADSSKVVVS